MTDENMIWLFKNKVFFGKPSKTGDGIYEE
jgi:hypothetical protein